MQEVLMLYIDQLVADMKARGITVDVIDGGGRRKPARYTRTSRNRNKRVTKNYLNSKGVTSTCQTDQ